MATEEQPSCLEQNPAYKPSAQYLAKLLSTHLTTTVDCEIQTLKFGEVCSSKEKIRGVEAMAKPATIKIRLNSTAGTGHFYVTRKNARTMTEKMKVRKFDPVARKHVEYKEGKIK